MKKIIAMILSLLIFTQLTGCGMSKENEAYAHYEAGEYLEAAEIFAELGDKEMQAESLYEAGHYREAEEIFREIGDLLGSSKCIGAMRGALNNIVPIN